MKDLETLMQGKLLEEQRERETMNACSWAVMLRTFRGKVLLGA